MSRRQAANAGTRRNGEGITSSAKSPINKLTLPKRLYVKARAEGKGPSDSAVEANVSPRMGRKYENEADVQAAYRQLVQKAIPAKKLVALIKGGSEAKIPVYGSDGQKRGERADWKTRKGYIEMAAKHGGYFEEKQVQGGGNIINLTVNHIGQKEQTSGMGKTIDARS